MTSRASTQSLEFLRVTISTDPTADPTSLPVEIAVPPSGEAPTSWLNANWELGGPPYVAAILIGPTADGSDVELAAGAYDVWVKITDAAETPAFIADRLVIFTTQLTLASVPELADTLGTTIDAEDAQATQALIAATAAARAYTGQTLTLVEGDVADLDGTGRDGLLLPQLPVLEVTQVDTIDSDGTPTTLDAADYRVDSAGILWLLDGSTWPLGHANVEVTYDHGNALIPADISAAVLSIAARRYIQAQASLTTVGGSLKSVTMGIYAETYATGADLSTQALSARGMTSEEEQLLAPYRTVRVA